MDDIMKLAIGFGAVYIFRWLIPLILIVLLVIRIIGAHKRCA